MSKSKLEPSVISSSVHPSSSIAPKAITVAMGDGIGPEIMEATLRILEAAGAQLQIHEISIGEKVYLDGITSGIEPGAWDRLRKTQVFLKAPITTPQGGGYKSLNVTVRKTLGLYANLRPCQSYAPYVRTKHPKMNVVIVRENEEDVYGGIEHRQTEEVYQCLKLISRPGCEKIIRYAFETATAMGRKKVSCFTKDNIMKMTDGLFHKVFDEIGSEYPDLEKDHWIVDIGAARLANTPEIFDVIVLPNLYGDILSDVAAEIAGSVGMAGSANIGDRIAMFEAIHGSAPKIAGQGIANPSGLLNGAVMMLNHIHQSDVAEKVQNAWLKTLEDGIHTFDIFDSSQSKKQVSTSDFASAVIDRLGEVPLHLPKVNFNQSKPDSVRRERSVRNVIPFTKELEGVDVFLHETHRDPNALAEKLIDVERTENFKLQMITNRGVKVWPEGQAETFCTDHWRCRFMHANGNAVAPVQVWQLLNRISGLGLDIIKTENLYRMNGEKSYALGQGQ